MDTAQPININAPVSLPETLENQYREIEREYYSLLQSGNPQKAFSIWSNFYTSILPAQPLNKRFHKGGPLHNMGIAKLFTNEPGEAFRLFIFAYIEDILSETDKFGADSTPASTTLTGVFRISQTDLQIIRGKVDTIVQRGVVSDPQAAFELYIQEPRAQTLAAQAKVLQLLIRQRYSISHIPGEWDKRVFVGGDYARFSELYKIHAFVKQQQYEPIIAVEFKIPPDLIHQHSLLLLHNCKYAIFDMATKSGQLMEAERTFDYRNKTLFICVDSLYSKISQMVTTYGVKIEPYKNDAELEQLIQKFLH